MGGGGNEYDLCHVICNVGFNYALINCVFGGVFTRTMRGPTGSPEYDIIV